MSVEKRLAALEELLADPQAIRNLLERTTDPRGGEPRVIDADGNTLDFQGAIQFLNATSVVDGQNQRVVVTPSGGGSGLVGEFSDDGTTTDAERLRFTSQSGPYPNHLVLDTLTVGAARIFGLLLAEDATTAGSTGDGVRVAGSADSAAGDAALYTQVTGANSTTVDIIAQDALAPTSSALIELRTFDGFGPIGNVLVADQNGNGAEWEMLASTTGAGAATSRLGATTVTGEANVKLEASSTGPNRAELEMLASATDTFAEVRLNGADQTTRRIYDVDGNSNFLQVDTDASTPGDPKRQVMRGPFVAALTPLGAAATVTFPWPNVWAAGASDASKAIIGGIQGAAGVELVQWSWAISIDPTEPDLTFTNTSLGTLNPTFVFFGVCDA